MNLVQRVGNAVKGVKMTFGMAAIDTCDDVEKRAYNQEKQFEDLIVMVRKLPFLHSAARIKRRLIFSRGYSLILKDKTISEEATDTIKKQLKEDQDNLKEFFNRSNGLNESLDQLLRTNVTDSELYGHDGLQAFDWESPEEVTFQHIRWNQFIMFVNELKPGMKGRRELLYYWINLLGILRNDEVLEEGQSGVSLTDSGISYKVLPFEFVHFKLNTETAYGLTPLFYDILSTQLIIDILEDNLKTVNGNGFKGIAIKTKGHIPPSFYKLDDNEKGAREAIIDSFLKKMKKALKGKQNKDAVLLFDGAIVDEFEKLDRGFTSVEYLEYVNSKASIVAASMVGLLAALLGDKDTTYASNIGDAIAFIVDNTILPSQHKYEQIITKQILDRYINNTGFLHFEYKFEFNRIDLSDPKVRADTFETLGDFITKLRAGAIVSINEAIKFVNDNVEGMIIESVDEPINDAGNIKTSEKPLLPINVEDIATEEDISVEEE